MSTALSAEAQAARHGDAQALAAALAAARAHTLRLFDAWRQALPADMAVRYAPDLNPPRWELGHLAWFEERWIARYPERLRGAAADPDTALAASLLPQADRLYDSSRVAHTTRWQLDLPDADRTLRYAAQVRERTLALLALSGCDDHCLYFFRWALLHEAMHAEAAVYTAQTLALPIAAALPQAGPAAGPAGRVACPGGPFVLGAPTLDSPTRDSQTPGSQTPGLQTPGLQTPGFVFDNERGAHAVELPPFEIDRSPVTWAAYRTFIDAGGYDEPAHWSAEGWAWRQRHSTGRPRHVTVDDGVWQRAAFGRWVALADDEPVMHLSHHEALAWCRWAGRRMPSEAEWEWAALHADGFRWGEVWEWTASPFVPYPGFEPHPYRDYSAPWFDGRPVLRGGSFATTPWLKHPRYRNYFPADRNDLFAGFRSCAA
ncbi:MAG: ergothioneine biosynthesis protein EgtB [Rubrivivax sp.]|nr:ergothioneine biosynthesis protein EgtB [Rubrivivax sp.]